MSAREMMREEADLIIDYGTVDGSTQTANLKNVLVDVNGLGDGVERAEDQDIFGNAAVLLRPMPPSGGKSFEVIFYRGGEQLIPIASREPRWQIDLEEGEVVVRSLSETAARVRLKPDGSCIVEAESIKLGSEDASKHVALAEDVESQLERIKSAIQGAAVGTSDGGALLKTNIMNALNGIAPPAAPFPESVASSKVQSE